MKYCVNFKKLSMDEYRKILSQQDLLPSRKILAQNVDSAFSSIKDAEIKNLGELLKALNTAAKLSSFSNRTGLSEEYLVILRREAGSLEPRSVALRDFPFMNGETHDILFRSNIKTSKDFYELFDTVEDVSRIAREKSISKDCVYELFCLCSLVRINGIGAAAAKCFFDAGFRSVSEVAEANPFDMLKRISEANADNRYYKAKLGEKDMQFCINYAKILLRISD
ncbi:MAG: hypothetical protein CVU91_07845 [Firmicutes bacterium HGW-Firmicutes-16]|nr:MAG: hypothetical protein CVU91_07845 [Firmicutes bacterium HGW-Firmicutes-16]